MNREISDKKLELLMNEAITDQYDMEIEEFEKLIEGLPDPEYSEEHKKKMKQLFARDRRESFIKKNAKKIRAACITFVCLCALSTVLLQVDAFRISFFNMLFGTQTEYSAIDYVDSDDLTKISGDIPKELNGVYIPKDLPDGYKYSYSENSRRSFTVEYVNGNKYVTIKQRSIQKARQTVNSEEGEPIEINGVQGKLFKSDTDIIIIWENNNVRFTITSNDVQGIIVTFAQNLEFQKKL